MKILFLSLFLSIAILSSGQIYNYKVDGLSGNTIDFKDFKGKKILIVNTASKCGLTPQYEGLEQLYQKYKDKLVIVGFPAGNFMGQELNKNEDIAAFCKKNYGVTFPMAAKISVKGKDIASIYKYLKEEAEKKGLENPVTWNFGKFLVNEKGELIATFSPKTKPASEDILKYLN